MTAQLIYAFFSDVVTGDQIMTAGTLDLVEDATYFYINGSDTPATAADLDNINPGDFVTMEISVTNAGSKSAWIQTELTLSGAASGADLNTIFTVYEGAGTGGNVLSGVPDTNSVIFSSDGTAIINGTHETELAAAGDTLTLSYTVYFDAAADNTWQNAAIDIGYTVKALQYRNNPVPDWSEAVALIPAP